MQQPNRSDYVDRIHSQLAGLVWPKLPTQGAATMLSVLFQFEQIQWWPADRILHHQLTQLRHVLHHAFQTVPFYQRTLPQELVSAPQSLTEVEWRRLPVLTRSQVQSAGDDLRSVKPPNHGRVTVVRSSGSTGRPVSVCKTELTTLFYNAVTLRDHLWRRRDLTGKMAVIRHLQNPQNAMPPNGNRPAHWGAATQCAFQSGPCAVLHSATNLADQVDWLVREDPHYLLTYPSILCELARHCVANKLHLSNLKQAATFGEALGDGVRDACRNAWNIEISDMYSAEETGYIALQCSETERYHTMAEDILVEILNDDDQPCAPGEIGRIVLTPLHNFAMPLIRYEVGDFAEVGEPCSCGRGLPTLKRILGRTRNLVRLPDGSRFRPALGIRQFEQAAPVRQAQLVQNSLTEIEANLVVEKPLNREQEKKLKAIIREKLGESFRVKLTYMDELPRSSRDKFEDFVSKVTE